MITRQPSKKLTICSVSMSMPTVVRPKNGVFVRRRLGALAEIANLNVIMPSPWFPGLSPMERHADDISEFKICSRRMFYVPGILKSLDRFWMRRALLPVIRHLHEDRRFDVMDAHFGYPTGAACCDVANTLKIPAFVTIRGVEQRQLKHRRIGPQLIHCLRNATGVIAVSHSLKETVVSSGIDEDKVQVIPNAVDTSSFSPGDRDAERAKLGLPKGVPLLISVGSMIPRKGYHDLLNAFVTVKQQVSDAELVIVGGGVRYDRGYPAQIRDQVQQLQLKHSVHLVGSVPPVEVPQWLRAADIFALATYQEGCCNGVLEALATGLPSIVTPAGDNERYITPGDNGYVVPIGDSEQLAQRLIEALQSNWNRAEIAGGVSQYSWADVAADVRDFMLKRI